MKDFKYKINGNDYAAHVEEQEDGTLKINLNGKEFVVELPAKAAAVRPVIKPVAAPTAVTTPAPRVVQAAGPASVTSPLPGTITDVKVKAGQKVKRGDVLLVMEAMKMANDITAEADGTIKNVCVSQGQSVNQGMILIEFVADAQPATAAPAPAPAAAPAPAPQPAAGANCVVAPLPGTVTEVLVKVGDKVSAGQNVLKLEAMKMENCITAESAGTVKAVRVQKGAQVQGGDVLIEMA